MNEKDLFLAAYRMDDPAERDRYLEKVCADRPTLLDRVRELLRLSDEVGSLMEPPESPTFASTSSTLVTGEAVSSVIGPYKLLEPIGEGGMGTVYMAEQTSPVRRLVALKVIKAGMDSRQVLARFEAERQALALMDHPNIAKVLDAGTTDQGRPYFVMELVKGRPITQYCDERRLKPHERLELFIPVCHAVQHAHQKGVIHRDLKPSNVIVGNYDGQAVPKVIDFGVAKATGQKLTEATLFTGFGTVLGTPEYMSPEQARIDNVDIDTRSDVYSLGILLYELLTGTTPLQHARVKEAAMLEILRLVREEDPPRPSTRLLTTEELPSIAANRGLEPRQLSSQIRGELDWIVMKALEKDRGRRYETADGLAMDLNRHLHDEPVAACPPTIGYQIRKFAKRNRSVVLVTSLVAISLVIGLIGTTWGMIEASWARSDAIAETKKKEDALVSVKKSERERSVQLFETLVSEARANRLVHRSGQRFETLATLKRAADLARELKLPEEKFVDLRSQAIAALTLPDMYPAGPWLPIPEDAMRFDFDADQKIYARTDRSGGCSVRRVADDSEICYIPSTKRPDIPTLGVVPYLSRDGKFVAVVGPPEMISEIGLDLWRIDGVKPVHVLSDPGAYYITFRDDSRLAAIHRKDGSIAVHELPAGTRLSLLPREGSTNEIRVMLHPSEPILAVTTYLDRSIAIRDIRNGRTLAKTMFEAGPTIEAWYPDGASLAVGLDDGRILQCDRDSLRLLRTVTQGTASRVSVATRIVFDKPGTRFATVDWDSKLNYYDTPTGQCLMTLPYSQLCPLSFVSNDRRLTGLSRDGLLSFWSVSDGREVIPLTHSNSEEVGTFGSVDVSPDGSLLVVGLLDAFCLWNLESGEELVNVPLPGNENRIFVKFDTDGSILVLGDKGVSKWPFRKQVDEALRWTLGPPRNIPLPPGNYLDRSQDGRIIVSCSRSGGAFAGGWRLSSDRPEVPVRFARGQDISFISVSPDGRWVLTIEQNLWSAQIWDARDGSLVKRLADRPVRRANFTADGRWITTSLEDGRLFTVGTWEPGPNLGGRLLVSSNGKVALVVPNHGVPRLVDPETHRVFATLPMLEEQSLQPQALSPDGSRLILYGSGIRVLNLRRIRKGLAEIGLDWDAPPFAPVDETATAPMSIEVVPGETTESVESSEVRARRSIENAKKAVDKNRDSPQALNTLAWRYITAPESLRDVGQGISLAEKASKLSPDSSMIRNTLGLAYYRGGRYREAVAVLRENLRQREHRFHAEDHYILAMAFARLGEADRARDHFDIADLWAKGQDAQKSAAADDLPLLRPEAARVLELESEAMPNGPAAFESEPSTSPKRM